MNYTMLAILQVAKNEWNQIRKNNEEGYTPHDCLDYALVYMSDNGEYYELTPQEHELLLSLMESEEK